MLKYQVGAVIVGQFGDYMPLGVEPVSNGYELAWKNPTTGQYSVWSTDTNGNYNGNFYMPGPGNSTGFETLETSFQQDLNGDGTIGVPRHSNTVQQVATVTGDHFVFETGGSEPSKSDGGYFSRADAVRFLTDHTQLGPASRAGELIAADDGHSSAPFHELLAGFILHH